MQGLISLLVSQDATPPWNQQWGPSVSDCCMCTSKDYMCEIHDFKERPRQGDIKTKLGLGKLPLHWVRKWNLVSEANARKRELGGWVHKKTWKTLWLRRVWEWHLSKKRNTDLRRVWEQSNRNSHLLRSYNSDRKELCSHPSLKPEDRRPEKIAYHGRRMHLTSDTASALSHDFHWRESEFGWQGSWSPFSQVCDAPYLCTHDN